MTTPAVQPASPEFVPQPAAEPDRDTVDAGTSRRPPVMADVARLAGVSHMTVSRVLNGHPSVSTTTRARVHAAMSQLDYRPNTAARALVTGRSRMIGVISVNTTLYGPASMLVAIERAARDAGYAVSVASLAALDRYSLSEAIEHLHARGVEGIVAITPNTSTRAALRYAPESVPVIAVEGGKGSVPTVAVDQFRGATIGTRHLLSLGHTVIGHIAGPEDWHEARERERGWRETMLAEGHRVPPVVRGDWSPRSGHTAMTDLLGVPGLSAVFAANDQMAIGAIRMLHEAGFTVPDQISVIGFDDIPEAAYLSPPLTTLRQDFGAVGRHSLQLLLDQVEGAPRTSKRVVIPPNLVVRESTGHRRPVGAGVPIPPPSPVT